MEIERGASVNVRTAYGETVRMKALSGPEPGRDFLVVWVCTETEYADAERGGREPEGLPWPVDAVAELAVP
jgi:hypothetical protein